MLIKNWTNPAIQLPAKRENKMPIKNWKIPAIQIPPKRRKLMQIRNLKIPTKMGKKILKTWKNPIIKIKELKARHA